MQKNYNELKSDNFNSYPHRVFCTAFMVDGRVADYEIGDRETNWGLRTFIGLTWEREIINNSEHNLYCEYNNVLVHDQNEHNKAFETLEKWIFNNFEKYPGAHLTRFFTEGEN